MSSASSYILSIGTLIGSSKSSDQITLQDSGYNVHCISLDQDLMAFRISTSISY